MRDALRQAAEQALDALDNAIDQLPKPYSTECAYAKDALRAQLEAPPQQAEPVAWIACSDRLPADKQVVVVAWATRVHPEWAIAIMRDGCFIDYTDGLGWGNPPTHWMPIPALPDKEGA
jgi:hypothetical protein